MRSLRGWTVTAFIAIVVSGCPRTVPEPAESDVSSGGIRSYRMGFSVVPPRPDLKIAVQSLEIWTKRADAAIMHLDVPWALLLAGTSPEDALRKDGVDLERYYR